MKSPGVRRVVACRWKSTKENSAARQVRYEVVWSDGTVDHFRSKNELPREARLFLTGYVASPVRSCPSRFGLGWVHEPERLTITWPTFHWLEFVLAIGALGLVPSAAWFYYFWYTKKPLQLTPFAFAGCLTAVIVVLLLNRFVRSRLRFERSTVQLWTNYGFLVRKEQWPRKNVLEAIIQITPYFAGERRRVRVSFTIRVRTDSGIEWRKIGGNFRRRKAQILPGELRRFVRVRTEFG